VVRPAAHTLLSCLRPIPEIPVADHAYSCSRN
jgi:hypothetical protein